MISGRDLSAADNPLLGVKQALLAMQRHSWEQGVAAQAFLESGDDDIVILMAYEAARRQLSDGRLAMVGGWNAVTDPAANGEPVLHAARLTGDPALREAAERQLDWLLGLAPRTRDGIWHHITDKPQVWVDSFYMAPPFLAVAGHPEEAVRQVEGFRALLWDDGARLYAHIWDEELGAHARVAHWGVGNGWAAAGLVRVIAALPAAMDADRQRLIAYLREGVDGCLAHLRSDGLFHDVVDDPSTFVETNLAQMLAYAIYRAVDAGWLPEPYLVSADRMRAAARAKVDRCRHGLETAARRHRRHPRDRRLTPGEHHHRRRADALCEGRHRREPGRHPRAPYRRGGPRRGYRPLPRDEPHRPRRAAAIPGGDPQPRRH